MSMFSKELKSAPSLRLFDWATTTLLRKQHATLPRLRTLAQDIPELSVLFLTPQTPPWHAEGVTVADHLARMMAALDLICTDPDFLKLDVWDDHDFQLFIRDVQATCVQHHDLLLAFILTHDLAKAQSVVLRAAEGSKGEREGFLGQHTATFTERERYLKLARSSLGSLQAQDAAVAAYETLQVRAHYPQHDRLGASMHFSEARLRVLTRVGLDDSYARFLATLIRLHLDALTAWSTRVDVRRLQAFDAIAQHAGINRDLFHDILPACILLDGVLGILQYHEGSYVVDALILKNYFTSEREAFPLRHEKRVLAERRGLRERVQAILANYDLSPEIIFKELQTPVGPVRGEVMREIYRALHEEGYVPHLGAKSEAFLPRLRKARAQIILEELPFL